MDKEISSYIKLFARRLKKETKVLDVGCGLRPYESFFSHCKYTGIDVKVSGRMLKDKKPDKFFDGLHIPFAENTFDAIICTEVLEHCIEPEILLMEMYRVLKKKGLIFLTVPFVWGLHETPYDFRRYSIYGIKKLFESAKLKITRIDKLTRGISAIEMLVSSEMNAYNIKHSTTNKSQFRKIKERFTYILWSKILRLWSILYDFDRVYIDNLVIATKE